jgi:cholest-4-en-3-one 26-monooxygenase
MSPTDTDVLDVDIYDPVLYGTAGTPYETFDALRHTAPISKRPDPEQPNGFWALTKHADVVHVSRNPEIFSSHEKTCFLNEMEAEQLAQQQLMMVNLDPPEHSRLRTLVNRGFTPRMVNRLRERIGAAADRIVDDALAKGEGDFVTMCAAELPLVVIAELLGVPHEDRHQLFDWTNRMIGAQDPNFEGLEDANVASLEVFNYANRLGAEKRGCPADDIVTKLISRDDETGNELSELEFDLFFMLLIVAGNETTRNSISGGMLAFHENPAQWERLRADLSLAGTAAEEAVRWMTPVNAFRRTAMQDTKIGDQAIAKGEKVVMFYASANRDEEVFEDPYTFDIGRDPNPHVGFGGGGAHFCLGRHLARLELEIMFTKLAERTRRVELIGDVRRLHSQFLNGIVSMPMRVVPAT